MESMCRLTTPEGSNVIYLRRPGKVASGLSPLLLIHGAASNMTRWTEFTQTTALTANRDVISIDLRGHGRSLYRGRIGLEIWGDDIAALLHRENWPRAVLIGHCLGANVAMMFAARHPRLTAGVVLVEPMLRQAFIGKLARLSRMSLPVKAMIAVIRILNSMGLYRRRLASLDLYELDKVFRAGLEQPGGGAALERRYASVWHDLKIMPSANYLQDLLEVTRPLPLDKMRAPFLALLSTGRTFVDPDVSAALLSALPSGEIHTFDAKHWIPTEQPRLMREFIDAWVAKLTV
ncbi:MAG: alpha/beta hydrolase [Gammaproteobacteria bacterium]